MEKARFFYTISVQISSDHRGGRNRPLLVAKANRDGNLNALYLCDHIFHYRILRAGKSGDMLTEHVVRVGKIIIRNQIELFVGAYVAIGQVLSGGGDEAAFAGRRVRIYRVCRANLRSDPEQSLPGIVYDPEDLLVFPEVDCRSVESHGHGNEQYTRYRKSQQYFGYCKPCFAS